MGWPNALAPKIERLVDLLSSIVLLLILQMKWKQECLWPVQSFSTFYTSKITIQCISTSASDDALILDGIL